MPPALAATADPTQPAPSGPEHARHALWAAIAMIVVWGSNFSVQKAVFTALSPGGFLFARYLMMPIAACALLFWRFGPKWPKLPRAELFALARLGLVGHLLEESRNPMAGEIWHRVEDEASEHMKPSRKIP